MTPKGQLNIEIGTKKNMKFPFHADVLRMTVKLRVSINWTLLLRHGTCEQQQKKPHEYEDLTRENVAAALHEFVRSD